MACECSNPHKYTCPACGVQTCSVECSKAHKLKSGCTGVLDPTRFVPKGELLTPTGLDRDYNFLQRMGRDIQLEAPEFKRRARDFVRNNVKVRSMPAQMSRAKMNKSGWSKQRQCYLWTVELKKDLKTMGTIVHVPDQQTIREITGLDEAVLIDADASKVKLSGDLTLAEALKDQCVAEFPTIFVGEMELSEDESDSDSDSSDPSSNDSDTSDSESDEHPEESSSKAPPACAQKPEVDTAAPTETEALVDATISVDAAETSEPEASAEIITPNPETSENEGSLPDMSLSEASLHNSKVADTPLNSGDMTGTAPVVETNHSIQVETPISSLQASSPATMTATGPQPPHGLVSTEGSFVEQKDITDLPQSVLDTVD